jgi:hypothetical protein
VDGDASGSTPRSAGRSAAEMASDLHRQARLPGSALKMGSCSGSVWQVDTPYWADGPSEPPWASAPAAPPTQTFSPPARQHSVYPEASEPKKPMISPSARRGGGGAAGGRGGRDAGEDWDREKRTMMDEMRKLQIANSELKQELTRARSRSASPWYVSACVHGRIYVCCVQKCRELFDKTHKDTNTPCTCTQGSTASSSRACEGSSREPGVF